ncbi:MAG: response regulator [Alphaproteobacteria bacterium]|jgi:CheY-like chemotaxis protein/membrane protease YdiL (CAAX protease family)|nr:response regulator [Alphaproteobacteria bacterium]MBT4965045.1 response regulator [Alphaproteobacteria bacterium]
MKSVLLVEDLAFSRAVTVRLLQSIEPCVITEVENVEQALDALHKNADFDIIITDLSMPGVSGLEFLKIIRSGKSPAAHDMPVIVASGKLTGPIQAALEALDIQAAINKPVKKEELVEALAAIGKSVRPSRTTEEYKAVRIASLMDADDQSKSLSPGKNLDQLVTFLEASPTLATLNRKEVELIAKGARTAHYPENTFIDGEEFGDTRLPVITWGEAEMLQSAQLPDGEEVEHRVVLLEAGNLLGTFNFMSPPAGQKYPKVRTTRSTEVVILEFADEDPNSELSVIRSKVKMAIGTIMSQRINYSDKALAISLTHRLAESKLKRTAGGYVITMACLLGFYTLTMRGVVDSELKGIARAASSAIMILIFAMPLFAILRKGVIKAQALGLTFRGARVAAIDAVVMSSAFLGILIAAKALLVTYVPAYQDGTVFELSKTFARYTPAGDVDWVFYTFNICMYAVFVPVQEIIVRCGLQSLLVEFLYGSDTRRAVTAIVASNIVFAAAHSHLNLGFATVTFLGGLFFGWIFYRNRSIVGVSISHFIIGAAAMYALGLETFIK